MAKNRTGTWLAWGLVAVGLFLVGIPGLWVYMSVTAKPLHPNPGDVPSVTRPALPHRWDASVESARKVVRTSLSARNLPGLSVAVGIRGDLVWAEGFGFADLDTRVPVTPQHLFRIGTASTMLTSAAAGLLMEEGRLSFDDVIQTYVPAFPEKQWPVTLGQLMGHLAGIRNDGGDEGPLFAEHCGQPVDALQYFARSSLLFQPGTQYRYSSFGWILVSAAVEAAAEQPFFTFMRNRIFLPLGMRDTQADLSIKPAPGQVTSYFPRFAADPTYGVDPMRDLDYSCYVGSSGFLSTPSDLVRFGMAINAGKLLRPPTVRLLQTSQRLLSGKETGYGLGWDLELVTLGGQPAQEVGHDGDVLGGMAASLLTFPQSGIAVSVASNISYAGTFSLAVKIAQSFSAAAGQSSRPVKN